MSPPNAPGGLFERIESEPDDTCLYHRIKMDYTYGLGRIYTDAEIAAARQSPSFPMEYDLKYLGSIGDVFHIKDIEMLMSKGKNLSETSNIYTAKSMGLDPGFGSSAFGVCVTEYRDGLIRVIYADEYARTDYNQMLDIAINLVQMFKMTIEGGSRIYCDGANPEFISSLKSRLGEDPSFLDCIKVIKQDTPGQREETAIENNMFVVPIYFGKRHKEMLAHCKRLIEENGLVAIHPRYDKLLIALRTATERDGKLDKEATSHDDLFDSFSMSLQFWLAHCKRLIEEDSGRIAISPRFSKLLVALHTATENGKGKLDKDATSHDEVFDAFRMSLQLWKQIYY